MTETDHQIPVGSEAVTYQLVPTATIKPGAYAAPARFLEVPHDRDLEQLCQIAAQLLEDPLAVRQLSDRVLELLQQDLNRQHERSGHYGRRW